MTVKKVISVPSQARALASDWPTPGKPGSRKGAFEFRILSLPLPPATFQWRLSHWNLWEFDEGDP